MRRSQTLLLMIALTFPALTLAGVNKVAVTVKPLYSMVSGIMKGVGEPALIMSGSASPHHYSLRPSERRILADADLVFWIGPDLETFMPRILRSMDESTVNVALINAPGLVRLPARSRHHHDHDTAHIDPHIWLSAENAHAMIDTIADSLIASDGTNAERYEANRQRMHARVSETDANIRRKLSGKTAAFLSYHDAYQYFEQAYDLNNAGFVTTSDEISPSARYVHQLRKTIREQQLHCLFYEAPNRPALVDALTQDFEVSALELDAIGLRLETSEDTWFQIMRNLAETYSRCL